MKFVLALSGGALRGVAHIGVLKALFDYDLKPSWISGTSAASMIASLYACGYSPYLDIKKGKSKTISRGLSQNMKVT